MKRAFRYLLVGILVSALAIDTALARRLFQRRSCRTECEISCPVSCPAPCEVTSCEVPICPTSYDCDCVAAEFIVSEPDCLGCEAQQQIEIAPTETYPIEPKPEQAMPAPTPIVNHDDTTDDTADEPADEPAPLAETTPAEPTPAQPNPAQPNPIEPAQDTAIFQPMLPPAPVAVPETTNEVAETPAPEPAEEQAPEASVVGDRYSNDRSSLFVPPSSIDSTAPASTPQPTPRPADTNDIFGEPTRSTAETEPLPSPVQPPAQKPAAQAEVDAEFDALFGPSDSAAQTDTAPQRPVEETRYAPIPAFESNNVEPEPAAPEPAKANSAEPRSVDPAVAEPATPDNATPEPETPQPEPTEPESEAEPEDYDPFGEGISVVDPQAETLMTAGGMRSNADRTWSDETASFSCQARLVRVTAKNVVLRRATGTQLTVPLMRLASEDLLFVQQQVTALRIVRARHAAAEKLAVAWSP